jgi:hypothetical protein
MPELGEATFTVRADTREAVRDLKSLEFQARKTARALAELAELQERCASLGIRFEHISIDDNKEDTVQ